MYMSKTKSAKQRVNTIRVITGSAKGIPLKVPHKARPITDRAKSSLFSVIGPDIIDKRVLDLFAGSGSLGIEALSRGAQHCVFVDISKYAKEDIENNLKKTKLSGKASVTQQPVFTFLNNQPEESFDIVFTDPPFNFYKPGKRGLALTLTSLLNHIHRLVPQGGAVILKHPTTTALPELKGFTLADTRDFGASTVTIWVKTEPL